MTTSGRRRLPRRRRMGHTPVAAAEVAEQSEARRADEARKSKEAGKASMAEKADEAGKAGNHARLKDDN